MPDLNDLMPLINAHQAELKQPGVASIRPGYLIQDGWPTKMPAIVVIVSKSSGNLTLPDHVEGVPVDVRRATDVEELRYQEPDRFAAIASQRAEFRHGAFDDIDPVAGMESVADEEDTVEVEAAKPSIAYTAPAGVSLQPVTGSFTITCHASPDAGWPMLRQFLSGTKSTLSVGMYDFTSKHILDAVQNGLVGKKDFMLTLDNPAKNPTADQTDTETVDALAGELGGEFHSAWALVRSNKAVQRWIFPTAYHIKVAVRDGAALWLSSGNWNNSNQPDFDPIGSPNGSSDQAIARKSDRDWHVIVEDPDLAKTYEAFLQHDFEVAHDEEASGNVTLEALTEDAVPEVFRTRAAATFEFHKPLRIENEEMTITPLLTPDAGVYQKAMLELLQSAASKLYVQLQYIHPSSKDADEDFTALINVVIAKINAHLDVRIILSQWQLSQGWLERLQSAGVDLDAVRIQNGVHNKGFVVDSKIVALGSQNWSAEGVLRNRDASVIIRHERAAQYYETIFLHDWNNIARRSVN
jgi:hypothetical protein